MAALQPAPTANYVAVLQAVLKGPTGKPEELRGAGDKGDSGKEYIEAGALASLRDGACLQLVRRRPLLPRVERTCALSDCSAPIGTLSTRRMSSSMRLASSSPRRGQPRTRPVGARASCVLPLTDITSVCPAAFAHLLIRPPLPQLVTAVPLAGLARSRGASYLGRLEHLAQRRLEARAEQRRMDPWALLHLTHALSLPPRVRAR